MVRNGSPKNRHNPWATTTGVRLRRPHTKKPGCARYKGGDEPDMSDRVMPQREGPGAPSRQIRPLP